MGQGLNVAERGMQSDLAAANLRGASGDLHAEATPEDVAYRGQRNRQEMELALKQFGKDPVARQALLAEMQQNSGDFSSEPNPFAAPDMQVAAAPAAPQGNPFAAPDMIQGAETDEPVTDAAKNVASGALSGLGAIFQGGGELAARGVNAVAGTDLRAVNPFQGAIDWLNESQSDVTKRKVGESQIRGSVFDKSTWDFGQNPNARGLIMQGLNAIGQFAPNLGIALLTAGASVPAQIGIGAVVGGLQGLGAAAGEERDKFMSMSDAELRQSSELYNTLTKRGVAPEEAKKAVAEAAALGGGIGNALPSGAEQAFEDFIVGALTKGRVKLPRLGGVVGRAVTGAIGGAAMGGAEEAGEQMAQNLGSNLAVGGNRPLDADTLQQFVMGAIAEGTAGSAVGALSKQPEQKVEPQPKLALDFGDGKIVTSPEELQRVFAPMGHNERLPALTAALERAYGAPLTDEEKSELERSFASVPLSEQGKVIGAALFPEEQPAREPQAKVTPEEEAPAAPAAPVPAKALVRAAKARLDELHKQAEEAKPQLLRIDAGKPVFTVGSNMHLTPEQETEYQFLSDNIDNPEALAKHYGVTLGAESPSKAKKETLPEGGKVVDQAVRAAKGQSAIGDTITSNEAKAAKEIDTARAAQAVVEEKPAPAEKPADTRPQPAAAVKSMEGDLSAIVGKRAPAASSKLAGTVAQASGVLKEEEAKTEAHKRAVEKSKAIEAERAAKTSEQSQPAPKNTKKEPAAAKEAKPAPAKKVAEPKPVQKKPASTKREQPEEVNKPAAPAAPAEPKAKLGPKGEEAVKKSKAAKPKLPELSATEKVMYKEALSVLKQHKGTSTPTAFVKQELGVPFSVAKSLVERARAEGKIPEDERPLLAVPAKRVAPHTATDQYQREAEDEQARRVLGTLLAKYLGKTPEEARQLFDVVPALSTEERRAQEVAEKFGQRLYFVVNKSDVDFNGVAAREHKMIFVAKESDRPVIGVAMHELLHRLRLENEHLYTEMRFALREWYDVRARVKQASVLNAGEAERGKPLITNDRMEEEFIAESLEEAAMDPKFWDMLAEREPSVFMRIVSAVLRILNAVLDFTKSENGSKFYTDVQATRRIIADAFIKWVRSQPEYQQTPLTNAFAKWFRGSRVVEDDGSPRVMYHGTARNDIKSFKPKQANAIYFTPDPATADEFTERSEHWMKEMGEGAKTAPVVYPAFVRAENPFDPDRVEHAEGLREWLRTKFSNDKQFREAQRAMGKTDSDPEFSPSVDRLLTRVKMGAWGAVENPVVQRYIRMHEYDGFYVYESGVKNLAVFSPEQVKSIFNDRYDETPLFARPTPKQRLALGQQINSIIPDSAKQLAANPAQKKHMEMLGAQKVLDLINRWAGDRMAPLGNLPSMGEYLISRGATMGLVAEANEEAKQFFNLFASANDAEKKKIYTYLTNKGAPKAMIGNTELADNAETLKKRLVQIGEDLVKRGVLDRKDYETYKGMYLPRLYLRHLLDESAYRGVGTGKKVSDLGYAKARKDIGEEYRLAVLGEIRDPGLLGGIAIGKPLRDMALLDFLDTISKNKDWAWQPSITTHNGQKVSVAWLKNEIERVEEQKALYKDAKQIADADTYIAGIRQTLTAAQQVAGGKAPEDYAEIPNSPRYGLLRGMYVRKEIHNDLVGAAHVSPDDWAESLFGYGGAGTKMTQWWKASKVSLNPPAQIRNFISNLMLLHLSGVAMHRMPMRLSQAVNSLVKKDKFYDIAMKYGVTVNTFAASELYHIRDEFLKDEGKGGPLAFLRYAKIITSHAGDAYQLMETVGKLAKIIDEMESYGSHETAAALEANKWLFDYTLVPKSVRFLRNAPLGMPFITFYYKLMPRLMEIALKYPWRFAPYVGAAYLIPQMIAAAGGPGPDDQEKLKKALAEWLRDKQHVYVLPQRDANGNWTFLDLSYLVPWTMVTDAGRQLAEGKISELVKTVGIFSGPFPDLVTAIKSGKDSFTGRDIASPGDPTNLKVGAWLTYLYNMAMPPIITNHNLIGPDLGNPTHAVTGRLPSALYGTTNKYGDPRNTVAQAVLGAMGLNIYPINPESSRLQEMSRMLFDIKDVKTRFVSQMRDQSLTEKERENLSRTYLDEMQRRMKELQKFAADSELPDNLTKQ